MQGLILFAHGARDARWAQPFEQVAARVRALQPELAVSLAYLELMAPDLDAAGQALVQAGCREVAVLPLFLGAGGHVRKDLPERLDRLRQAHPGVQWTLRPAAGESPRLVEALAQIAIDPMDTTNQERA
ncbi:MAG TPA: CbiX/SirB N-terminal domain-containing protein [Ideonella sp.]|uniref:sirohydrochlorin chelatase n=1 Tax=Ideonella sp. TaxID=1929293 RepID=UPI002E3509AB|nr:CbiX/SirB N-terminal domain-containing protein [Ideonella sp.]HEX5683393.1 CbiX/SirB N-terminal domain-containing protein [Ideonella sp.]